MMHHAVFKKWQIQLWDVGRLIWTAATSTGCQSNCRLSHHEPRKSFSKRWPGLTPSERPLIGCKVEGWFIIVNKRGWQLKSAGGDVPGMPSSTALCCMQIQTINFSHPATDTYTDTFIWIIHAYIQTRLTDKKCGLKIYPQFSNLPPFSNTFLDYADHPCYKCFIWYGML